MPLVFYFEAIIAKVLTLISSQDYNSAIIMASKITDAIVPPLLAIPVFLLAALIIKNSERKKAVYIYTLCAFSALYVAFILVLASDFHKNAVGLIFLVSSLYFIYKYNEFRTKRELIIASIFFVLCFLTHIGSFGALLLFALIFSILILIRSSVAIKKYKKILLTGIATLVSLTIVLFLLDIKRLERFSSVINSPLILFENPVLLFLLDNQLVYHGFWLVNFMAINLLSIAGFIYLMIRKTALALKGDFLLLQSA